MEVDGRRIPFEEGDSILIAMLRVGVHPMSGGALCLEGDCGRCLVSVDGVAYERSCQRPARADLQVRCSHDGGAPPLPDAPTSDCAQPERVHEWWDVVVVGQGRSGRQAAERAREEGFEVRTVDAEAGEHCVGIYPGGQVVTRGEAGMAILQARREVVIATGAAELLPIVPGSELRGLYSPRAARRLAEAGVDLGQVVSVNGELPLEGARRIDGRLLRFEGEGSLRAVVVVDAGGVEQRVECDTAVVHLGASPRDALRRMAGGDAVRAVGAVSRPTELPPCPEQGVLCPCAGVRIADLASAWDRGFRELELVKRATLAGTGTCQGSTCLPYLRSFLAQRAQPRGEGPPPLQSAPAPFTARPVTRQLSVEQAAAGVHHRATPRTALDAEHRARGAIMQRAGGWWRPWSYGEVEAEVRAVRDAVSLGDVSTLGKMLVQGPDATALLQHLYPARIADLKPGRCRYVLMLNERGAVLDDGLVCREAEDRYSLSFTSAGSNLAELWIRDWADGRGDDVRILEQTASRGAINVSGPRAAELLARAGLGDPPAFLRHAEARVADVDCRVLRLSFTGELSYELHHDAADSVALWRRLLRLGEGLGIRPHGLEALLRLRLEKGHLVVGQDTDFDSTPRRLGHEWALRRDEVDFVGRAALRRTDARELDRQLVGLEMDGPAPIEGAVIQDGEGYAGFVTSSARSLTLGRTVMLGWLARRQGELPSRVTIDGREARRVSTPFYDPKAERARVRVPTREVEAPSFPPEPPEDAGARWRRMPGTRVVATPAALDAWTAARGSEERVLRFAPDELWTTIAAEEVRIGDPHALVRRETGYSGAWWDADEASERLARHCEWELPRTRPAFAQGLVAEVPVRLWLEEDRVLFLVRTPLASTLEARL